MEPLKLEEGTKGENKPEDATAPENAIISTFSIDQAQFTETLPYPYMGWCDLCQPNQEGEKKVIRHVALDFNRVKHPIRENCFAKVLLDLKRRGEA